jgi:hypothetical protein
MIQITPDELDKLVRLAFNEGVSAGMDDFTTSRGGRSWPESKAKAKLDAIVSSKPDMQTTDKP